MYLASGAPVPAASMIRYDYAARDWLIPATPLSLPNYTHGLLGLERGRTDVRKETRL